MLDYYHADRLDVGMPSRLEYDQGFFVKNGDGSADVNAHRPPLQDPGLPAG
jgi:NH3-dependent NAD+ synthetase